MSTPDEERAPIQTNNIRVLWAAVFLIAACLLWAGMILGNGFDAGARFSTPSLHAPGGRAVIFDVGRTVFSAFNKVEIGWCLLTFWLLCIVRPFHRAPRLVGVLLPSVWLIIALQSVFLLPVLVQRALLVMHDQPLPASPVHALYSSSEMVKLTALIACGVLLIRALVGNSPR